MLYKTLILSLFMSALQMNAFAGQALSEQQHRVITQEVTDAFGQLVNASKQKDSQAYLALIDRDRFVGMSAEGTVWKSADPLETLIVSSFAVPFTLESLAFTVVKISVIDGQTAVLVNEYEQTVRMKEGARHTYSGAGAQVWSKVSGNWKLVSISASNKPNN